MREPEHWRDMPSWFVITARLVGGTLIFSFNWWMEFENVIFLEAEMGKAIELVNQEQIVSKIYYIRGQKVMLDRDLAGLYGVETRTLNQGVKRNLERFPKDFMFQLTKEEMKNWISQFVTSNSVKMGLRKAPFAFTQEGVAMLSSVLNSSKAIQVNIQIMRTFIRLKKVLGNNELIYRRLEQIEKKLIVHDLSFDRVFEAIDLMLDQPKEPLSKVGFLKEENDA